MTQSTSSTQAFIDLNNVLKPLNELTENSTH